MERGATKLGRLYVASIAIKKEFSSLNGISRLMFVLLALVARHDCVQSLAMVLFHTHAFELPGDYLHNRRSGILALAMVFGLER